MNAVCTRQDFVSVRLSTSTEEEGARARWTPSLTCDTQAETSTPRTGGIHTFEALHNVGISSRVRVYNTRQGRSACTNTKSTERTYEYHTGTAHTRHETHAAVKFPHSEPPPYRKKENANSAKYKRQDRGQSIEATIADCLRKNRSLFKFVMRGFKKLDSVKSRGAVPLKNRTISYSLHDQGSPRSFTTV